MLAQKSYTRSDGYRVEVTDHGGEWEVVVVEGGKATTSVFSVEEHARSYAAGQRYRLGLHVDVEG